jgi:DNA-binding winged helix-turn-helix (wHTH) protein
LPVRYRFGDFVLSPARRVLASGGRPVPLIPRYFDVLVLLVEQRDRAVTKQEIFERVWSDVVVSDSALTQAIRSIRQALGDDPRESRFVRTVSRRGYQFVFTPLVEEDDAGPWPANVESADGAAAEPALPGIDAAVDAAGGASAEPPFQPAARPAPEAWRALDEMAMAAGGAALSTATAGALAGLAGGLALRAVAGSQSDAQVALTFALVGALAGALGGGGVGIGIAAVEAKGSSQAVPLALGGAVTGLGIGWLAHSAARAVLAGLFGRDVPAMGGPLEGLVIGAAAGAGYAIGAHSLAPAGAAALRGWPRWRVVLTTALATGAGGVALALAGGHFVGASLDLMSGTFAGSQVGLEPLARLLGEARMGPVTRVVASAIETSLFGAAIAFGLTWRRRRGAA